MVASSTGWAWLLELILNLISSQGLLKSKTTTSNDWALLPELVLNLILHKLQELPDCVRFASVCTTRRIAAKNSGNKQFPVPVLLIPKTSNRNKIAKTLLFSVQENKTYNVQIRIDESTFRFCGSSHGWICAVESDFSITLSSPTTKNPQSATVRLPPITSIDDQCLGLTSGLQEGIQGSRHYIPQFCIRKVTLSADPTATRDYFVVAIYGFRRQLAILRSGDGSWTYLDRSLGLFSDATWHKNKLYAVNQLGELMQIDGVNSRNLSPSMVYSTNYNPQKNITRFYLVESSRGELLLVERYIDPTMQDQNGRNSFKVHRLEMSSEMQWFIPNSKSFHFFHCLTRGHSFVLDLLV